MTLRQAQGERDKLASVAARIARVEVLLERVLPIVRSWVAGEIECRSELAEMPNGEVWPMPHDALIAECAGDIALVRELQDYLGTAPEADPDWFDDLVAAVQS